jgi:hypothetical protein
MGLAIDGPRAYMLVGKSPTARPVYSTALLTTLFIQIDTAQRR